MRRALRENAVCALAAGAASAAMAWLGLYGFAWNDYEIEAQPAVNALTHGHVLEFMRLAPAYGGSLVERAPFALLPGLWGGGSLAVYRMVAVPCLLAGATLGVWLCAQMRARGRKTLWRAIVLGVCVANPLTLQALELGHPEELLGACLCVAAVLLAGAGRPLWAGLLLGLAIANKEWALVATGPVLLALVAGVGAFRWKQVAVCLASAGAVAAVVLTPLLLASPGGFAVKTGQIFQPWQVWWFFGRHGQLVTRMFGATLPGYRISPGWASTISHPLIVLVGLGMAGALWLRRGREVRAITAHDALLLLALVLLLRCILDTWDTGYYMLPFLIALLSWEALGQSRRPPIAALVGVVLPWLLLKELSARGVSPDLQAALFLVWTLPLAMVIGLALYAPGLLSRIGEVRGVKTPGQAADNRLKWLHVLTR
jgi:Glycosyltransferase family 87